MMSRACVCLCRSGCAQGRKTCMLVAGPPRDGIIRTSPGQECSKDKGALPGARRISVYAARFRSATGCKTRVCFKPYHLILHLGEKRVSLCSAKRQSARSSMDRASDYGSEGWGFESLRARSGPPRCDPPAGFCILESTPAGVLFLYPPATAATVVTGGIACCDASRAWRRHDPRLGRQRTQPLNPQRICDIGGATRPGHSQGRPNEGHDVRGGPAQAS